MHHNENMWDMGGLKEKMPVTYYSFLSGSLALAGIIPFAGFWSKDEVLYETLVYGLGTATGSSTLLLLGYAFGLVAVFFTGFYTFRMVFLTFHGDARSETAEDPHGVRWNVKVPLAVLGVLAATVGFINMTPVAKLTGLHIEFLHQWLDMAPEGYLTNVHHYEEVLHSAAHYQAAGIGPLAPGAVSLALALAGSGLAYRLYGTSAHPEPHTEKLGSLRTLLMHNYYLDEFQVWLATGVTYRVARAANTFDQGVVDGVVNGVSSVSLFSGSRVRRIQSGVVSNYASLITLSLVLLVAFFGLMGGWF
jgi:NADH-quinone oxidoreductase subunit L